jgi:hypothetical protein
VPTAGHLFIYFQADDEPISTTSKAGASLIETTNPARGDRHAFLYDWTIHATSHQQSYGKSHEQSR